MGLSMWGYGLDAPGPDSLRPIDVATRRGLSLMFRGLLAAGADASTKAPGARKTPIELGRRLMRDDLPQSVLSKAVCEELRSSTMPSGLATPSHLGKSSVGVCDTGHGQALAQKEVEAIKTRQRSTRL